MRGEGGLLGGESGDEPNVEGAGCLRETQRMRLENMGHALTLQRDDDSWLREE